MFTANLSRMVLFVFAAVLAVKGAVALRVQGQQTAGDVFEVASVKASPPQQLGGRGVPGRGGACSGFPQIEPARFAATRATAYLLISWGYGKDCFSAEAHELISGGPRWIASDQFEIQAVIPAGTPTYTSGQFNSGDAPKLQIMIRNLVRDRFKVEAHSESRDMPVYALTVNKGGPKLTRFEEGSCDASPPPPPFKPGQKRACFRGIDITPSLKLRVAATGVTLDRYALMLSMALDRPVIDKTGIAGVFDIDLQSAVEGTRMAQFLPPDGNLRPVPSEPAPSIFTAIQDQLGLKLEATKAPVEVLVIDHAEKPSEN